MSCNVNSVLVPASSSRDVLCSGSPATAGSYRVRVDYTVGSSSTTASSGTFTVSGTTTTSPSPNSCTLALDHTSLSSTSIASGDILNIVVRERMTFTGYSNPWATAMVTIEGPGSSTQVASQTKVYTFSSSGSTNEQTFSFATTSWSVGTYKVFVESTGLENCGRISKLQLGTFQVNPATTSSITTVGQSSTGNAIYVAKFEQVTKEKVEEKPVTRALVYPTVSMTQTTVLWEQVALVGLGLAVIVLLGAVAWLSMGGRIGQVSNRQEYAKGGWEEFSEAKNSGVESSKPSAKYENMEDV